MIDPLARDRVRIQGRSHARVEEEHLLLVVRVVVDLATALGDQSSFGGRDRSPDRQVNVSYIRTVSE